MTLLARMSLQPALKVSQTEKLTRKGGYKIALDHTAENVTHLHFEDHRLFRDLLGQHNDHIRALERAIGVKIGVAGASLSIGGDEVERELASRVISQIYGLLENGYPIYSSDVDYAIRILSGNRNARLKDIFLDTIYVAGNRRVITPKSVAQKAYIDAIRNFDIVFGIGPAGTGKTFLAMAVAVAELMKNNFSRIVLTRPAVEAGEKLGFLPGDLAEKINPYLRPLYDALHDMVDFDRVRKMMERSIIEVAPLAFMRGRTLNDSFVILDEAQNTTNEQMKMFLTRLGYGSKAVITGDITQVDLPVGTRSGLKQAWGILKDITDIKFVFFTEKDVVRHRLVQDVILAYERMEAQKESSRAGAKRAEIPAQGEGGGLRYEGASGSESWEYDAVGEDDSSADGENGGGAQPGSG